MRPEQAGIETIKYPSPPGIETATSCVDSISRSRWATLRDSLLQRAFILRSLARGCQLPLRRRRVSCRVEDFGGEAESKEKGGFKQSNSAMGKGESSSKKVITKEEWEKKLSEVKIMKEDMNKLVMNFLVTEGYVEAAEKFQMESGTQPDIDLGTITDRMAVRKAVQCGQVEDAIEKVNDLNPEILDTNPQLFFHLQQQRLIELIRSGQVEEALEFAQEELAPRGEENHAFLEELERTVALLAFEDTVNCPVGELLDISQRQKTASELNAAILTSQSHEKDPKLPSLLKMLIWAQNQLDEKASYPRINDLVNATLEEPVT
ncbi:unnamed protein product [Sphagnum balticum]